MKKRYEYGGEVDAMEAANKSEEAMDIADSMKRGAPGMSETVKATPKAAPKAASKPAAKAAPKLIDPSNIRSGRREFEESQMAPADKTKMSVADRAKANRESARSGSSTTDRRSVGERLRSALAGKDRGGNTVDFSGSGMGMKSGGMTASKRGDGIASRGKTRGKMC